MITLHLTLLSFKEAKVKTTRFFFCSIHVHVVSYPHIGTHRINRMREKFFKVIGNRHVYITLNELSMQ